MKRLVKIIALCLCLTLFGVLFAGCDMLDEMKANHAILSEDKETISFRGETYKRMPEDVGIYLSTYFYYGSDIAVTDSDVPVLLSKSFSYMCEYDIVKDIFIVYVDFDKPEDSFLSSYAMADSEYYCNEKDYDKYIDVIENGILDRLGFEYEYCDEEYNYHYKLEVGSETISSEILGYIKNPEKMTKDIFDKVYNDYNSEYLMGGLYKCDSEGILADPIESFDILRLGKEAYLVNYTTEVAVKLSQASFDELEDKYYYGDYQYTDTDAEVEYIGVIGGADGETDIFVG